jgi:Zn-dependent peptidase ImmA (M78 family)/DNA-binding XRE family transcriptional regulator
LIGERVRAVRTYFCWSQEQLAGFAGVSQAYVSKLEKSNSASDDTIAAIARASGFSIEFFHRGPLPDMPTGSLRFRKRSSSRARDDERVRAHVRFAVETMDKALRDECRLELPPILIRAVPDSEPIDPDAIERLATKTRETLSLGARDPIPHLIRAVERAGVVIIGSAHGVEGHDAASFWPRFPDGRPVIVTTRGLAGDRQRFSTAHEVGHLLLHQRRDVAATENQAESEADRFASALLLPADTARERMSGDVTLRSLAYIKAEYGISIAAMIRRALDLQVIDTARRTSLEKQLTSRGWRKSEPVEVQEERPLLISKMIEAATKTQSLSQQARETGLARQTLREMAA